MTAAGRVADPTGGDPAGRTEQPVRQRLAATDRVGLLGQDEECDLGGVLGVVGVAGDVAADAEHHRRVPPHQGLERFLRDRVAPEEAPQQRRVVEGGRRARVPQPLDQSDDASRMGPCHRSIPLPDRLSREVPGGTLDFLKNPGRRPFFHKRRAKPYRGHVHPHQAA